MIYNIIIITAYVLVSHQPRLVKVDTFRQTLANNSMSHKKKLKKHFSLFYKMYSSVETDPAARLGLFQAQFILKYLKPFKYVLPHDLVPGRRGSVKRRRQLERQQALPCYGDKLLSFYLALRTKKKEKKNNIKETRWKRCLASSS